MTHHLLPYLSAELNIHVFVFCWRFLEYMSPVQHICPVLNLYKTTHTIMMLCFWLLLPDLLHPTSRYVTCSNISWRFSVDAKKKRWVECTTYTRCIHKFQVHHSEIPPIMAPSIRRREVLNTEAQKKSTVLDSIKHKYQGVLSLVNYVLFFCLRTLYAFHTNWVFFNLCFFCLFVRFVFDNRFIWYFQVIQLSCMALFETRR